MSAVDEDGEPSPPGGQAAAAAAAPRWITAGEAAQYAPPTGEDVQRAVEMASAAIERHRAEHGPYLRELRCTPLVSWVLVASYGVDEAKAFGGPWHGLGTPLFEDAGIPFGVLRCFYDDESTRDIQVIDPDILATFLHPKPFEFKAPTVNEFSRLYAWSLQFAPLTPPRPTPGLGPLGSGY